MLYNISKEELPMSYGKSLAHTFEVSIVQKVTNILFGQQDISLQVSEELMKKQSKSMLMTNEKKMPWE